jgi:hypothetical protein
MTVIPCKVCWVERLYTAHSDPCRISFCHRTDLGLRLTQKAVCYVWTSCFLYFFVEVVKKCTIDTSHVSLYPDRGPNPGFHYFSQDPALGGIALLCAEPYIHSLVICLIPCLDCRLVAIVRAICCHSLHMKMRHQQISYRIVLIHFCCSILQAGLFGELH